MLRGLAKQFKMPVAFNSSAGDMKAQELTEQIEEVIDAVSEHSLRPVSR